ncbi:hypothetical protein JCM9279_001930 [Rhodotorula babjevae]
MSSTNNDSPLSAGTGRATNTVPKLSGKDNYLRWLRSLKLYFQKHKLWDVVSGAEKKPTVADGALAAALDNVKVASWESKDVAARFDIVSTVNAEQQERLFNIDSTNEPTAADYWSLLERQNKPKGDVGTQLLLEQLHNSRYVDGQPMDKHLARMRSLAVQLASIGQPVNDTIFMMYVKKSLPPSWGTIVFLLDNETHNKDSICNRIQLKADRLAAARNGATSSSSSRRNPAALAANPSSSSQGQGKGCRDKSKDVCYNCGKTGHHSRECHLKPTAATVAARQLKSSERAPAFSADSPPHLVTYSLAAHLPLASRAAPTRLEDEPWIIDSGAGLHSTGRRDALANFIAEEHKIEVADHRIVVSPGYGTATLQNSDGARVQLSRVMYLPGAANGLLSVTALAQHGVDVAFKAKERTGTVTKGNNTLFSTIAGTGYVLNAHLVAPDPAAPPSPPPAAARVLAVSTRDTTSAPLMAWHRRYRHIAPLTILKLDRQGLVNGLNLSDKVVEDCESCLTSKSTRSPFRSTSTPAEHNLHRIFINLAFVDHEDDEGRKIFLAIVDQRSTAKWSFALSSKSSEEVLKTSNLWRRNAETQCGQRLRIVRSDNGNEFVNNSFLSYLKEHGILHETTAPYTPKQNAQVERLNGSLIALVKTMLHDTRLPKSMWSYALSVATYVSNRTVHPRLRMTAYEAFTGRRPTVGHLRPFGCTAYVHIDKLLRSKLDDLAVKGVLVGYSGDYNYVVQLADSGKLVTTRHASFGRREDSDIAILDPLPPSSSPSPLLSRSQHNDDEQHADANGQEHVEKEPALPHGPPPPPLPPRDGYDYVQVRSGPNPGRFENINTSNIIEGRCRTRGRLAHDDSAIYAKVSIVLDQEEPLDGSWEEDSLFVGVALPSTPCTYAKALASPHARQWQTAMSEEFDAFDAHDVLLPTRLPAGARALGTTWVYTLKTNADGSTRYKARLVAQGFAQRPGIDVNETFAPVARASTIRYVIALAAGKGLELHHFDFSTAFLNGKMTEDIFIKVPPGYPGKVINGQVLKLVSSMYGTKQAPRKWHKALEALMVRQGYAPSSSDLCLFTKTVKGSLVIIAIYVDNGHIAASSEEVIKAELSALNSAYTLKHLGPASTFLSIEVAHLDDGVLIHHSKYVRSVLERFGIVVPSRRRASTPMEARPAVDTSPPFHDIPLYQSAVGALMFTATFVRADLAVAVRAAAQKVVSPTQQDWDTVKHIFLYLLNTVDLGIFYQHGASLELVAYSDASWADDPETRRSVGRYAILVAGGVVSWRSKQQALVATSTTKSELVAASNTTKEVLSMRKVAVDVGEAPQGPTTIFEDNQAAIAISSNPASHGHTKHFDVAQLFVRERVKTGEVSLKYISTNDMVANTLTKPLTRAKFKQHRLAMGMVALSTRTRRSIG